MHKNVRRLASAYFVLASVVAHANYRDVPRQHWAFEEANWVRTSGLIPGVTGDQFRGDSTMSRYEMSNILASYMRTYYAKRDEIDAELRALGKADAQRAQLLQQLDQEAARLFARLEAGEVPAPLAQPGIEPQDPEPLPAPSYVAPNPVVATPAPETSSAAPPAASSALSDRLAAMRARLRQSRGGQTARDALAKSGR